MPAAPGPPTDGDAIACIREQQLMTRAELAARVGRTPQWITNIENGYVNAPAVMLTLIASVLGVPESRITYKGDLTLADRARTRGARRFALAQQAQEPRRSALPRRREGADRLVLPKQQQAHGFMTAAT